MGTVIGIASQCVQTIANSNYILTVGVGGVVSVLFMFGVSAVSVFSNEHTLSPSPGVKREKLFFKTSLEDSCESVISGKLLGS